MRRREFLWAGLGVFLSGCGGGDSSPSLEELLSNQPPGNSENSGRLTLNGYVLIDLHHSGYSHSRAESINTHGHVVGTLFGADCIRPPLPGGGITGGVSGGAMPPCTGGAFLYRGAATEDLGVGASSLKRAVSNNDRGQIIGLGGTGQDVWPTLWEDGTLTRIGSREGLGDVRQINNSGLIIGDTSEGTSIRRDGVLTPLKGLGKSGQEFPATGNALNDAGDAAGFSLTGKTIPGTMAHATRAVLWRDGRIIDLGTNGGYASCATALNNGGDVVGYSFPAEASQDGLFTSRAVLWQHDGKVVDLGSLGGRSARAEDINEAGQIVGGSTLRGERMSHPFLWQNGQMLDLNTLLPKDSGWILVSATDINDRGQICGMGVYRGKQHAFLLTPQ
jgi:probable HAF family extracellular repeat protein